MLMVHTYTRPCVTSIGKNTEIFAEDRREETRLLHSAIIAETSEVFL
ncbi:hypothetical protein SAMN02745131_04118 [Flavisolibacter ginsengisoli DSM 18119]|jgi:hypothetical protein|uniref:Uncharacterized protein n=1 Tax=Flavisolibacter ginsengisoli DSM 18119 TaxID=1121884 RepID=A0A1M5GDW5_9BACT|nr:hypothetical protein SAMN02745131_04118 [Flavisolibacter ginsengisoli DSM 18119]